MGENLMSRDDTVRIDRTNDEHTFSSVQILTHVRVSLLISKDCIYHSHELWLLLRILTLGRPALAHVVVAVVVVVVIRVVGAID